MYICLYVYCVYVYLVEWAPPKSMVCMFSHVSVYICVYIHTRTYIHIHTYTYIHTLGVPSQRKRRSIRERSLRICLKW